MISFDWKVWRGVAFFLSAYFSFRCRILGKLVSTTSLMKTRHWTLLLPLLLTGGRLFAQPLPQVEVVQQFRHVTMTPREISVAADGSVLGTTDAPGFGIFRVTSAGAVSFPAGGENVELEHPFVETAGGDFFGADFSTIYRFVAPSTLSVLVTLNPATQGLIWSSLQIDGSGNIYVLLSPEGNSDGVDYRIVKMTPAGAVTTLYQFTSSGAFRFAKSLVLHPNGLLYGLARETSSFDDVLYSLPTSGGTPTVVALTDIDEGLIVADDDNLYGIQDDDVYRVTPGGTVTFVATPPIPPDELFSIPGGGGDILVLRSARILRVATNGTVSDVYPGDEGLTGLAVASDGTLYLGIPRPFEQPVSGRIDTLVPPAAPTTLANLPYSSNGRDPIGPLALGLDGNFYGLTKGGGAADEGVFFRVSPAGAYTRVVDFTGLASQPKTIFSGLTTGPDGGLYFSGRDGSGAYLIYRIETNGTVAPANVTTPGGLPQNSLFLNGGVLHGLSSTGVITRFPLGGTAVALTSPLGGALVRPPVAVSANGDMSFLWGTFSGVLDSQVSRYSAAGALIGTYSFPASPSSASVKLAAGPGNAIYGFTRRYFPPGGSRSDLFVIEGANNYSVVAGFVGLPTNSNSGIVGSEGGLFYSGDSDGPFKIDALGTRTTLATWSPAAPQFVRSLQRIAADRLFGISDEAAATSNGTLTTFQNTFVPPPTPDPTPTTGPIPGPVPSATVDSVPPELAVRGRKTVETLRKRVVIRGTVTDASGISKVDVKVRGAKAKVKLLAGSRFKVVLKVTKDSGRVIVKLLATDNAGLRSKQEKLRILRR